jgi:F-type H+-transporting ATPase subunit b
MDLVTPGIGLLFWTTLVFIILVVLLSKFAWKPILGAVKAREESIDNALKSAEKAREEMANLNADNERILKEARAERDALLKEAREMKDAIIAEAKNSATKEADKVMLAAKEAINNEKMAALTELKNTVGSLSLEIAEKVLKSELASDEKQQELVKSLLNDVSLN